MDANVCCIGCPFDISSLNVVVNCCVYHLFLLFVHALFFTNSFCLEVVLRLVVVPSVFPEASSPLALRAMRF